MIIILSISKRASYITTSSDVWGDKFCWTSEQEVYRNDVVVSGSNADHTLVTPRPEIESVFLTHSLRFITALITEFIPSFRHERSHKGRSLQTVNLHLASPVRSRWWTKLQSDFVPSLGRFGSNLLLQQLILKLDHGWSRLGMFIVEVLLVYILHGCGSCHQSLFGCDLVEGSRELFIADDITRLYGSHRQSRFSCSFVGVGRLVYGGSRRQSRFSFNSVVLWWVWELHISGIYQVACSSVVDELRYHTSLLWNGLVGWVFGTACCNSFTYLPISFP